MTTTTDTSTTMGMSTMTDTSSTMTDTSTMTDIGTTTDTSTAPSRLPLYALAPGIFAPLLALTKAAKKDLDPALVELLLIRASQLNRCAYCLDMHITDARKAGESEQRIALLNAWEEVPGLYTERERAALALTEAVTVLTDGFVPDAVYERAAAHFEDAELARLIALITAINCWNRLNVAARIPVGWDFGGNSRAQG